MTHKVAKSTRALVSSATQEGLEMKSAGSQGGSSREWGGGNVAWHVGAGRGSGQCASKRCLPSTAGEPCWPTCRAQKAPAELQRPVGSKQGGNTLVAASQLCANKVEEDGQHVAPLLRQPASKLADRVSESIRKIE